MYFCLGAGYRSSLQPKPLPCASRARDPSGNPPGTRREVDILRECKAQVAILQDGRATYVYLLRNQPRMVKIWELLDSHVHAGDSGRIPGLDTTKEKLPDKPTLSRNGDVIK